MTMSGHIKPFKYNEKAFNLEGPNQFQRVHFCHVVIAWILV